MAVNRKRLSELAVKELRKLFEEKEQPIEEDKGWLLKRIEKLEEELKKEREKNAQLRAPKK